MQEFNKVTLEKIDTTGIMRFNDPDAMNAVSNEMLDGIWSCLNEIEDINSNIKCLVITGEGRGFCAGANLSGGSDRGNTGRHCLLYTSDAADE